MHYTVTRSRTCRIAAGRTRHPPHTRVRTRAHSHTRTHATDPHRRFADGFPNLFVKDATKIRNRHVGFLASFHSSEVIFDQLSIIYQLPRMFIGSFTLVLPYFPTGTAERVRAGSVRAPAGCVWCVWGWERGSTAAPQPLETRGRGGGDEQPSTIKF